MLPHDSQFAALKEKLLTMSSLAATSVRNAVKALVERDDALARQVEADDDTLDRMEIELDELCIVRSLHTEAINHDPAITFTVTLPSSAGTAGVATRMKGVADTSTTGARSFSRLYGRSGRTAGTTASSRCLDR